MKKWLYAVGLGVALAVSAGQAAAEKIAVANIAEIFQNLPQRDAVAQKLDNEFKGRAAELQKMEKSLQTKINKLQKEGMTMKASERSQMEKDIGKERDTFAGKAKAFEDDNRARQTEERNRLLSVIRTAIEQVASQEGYTLVLDANTVLFAQAIPDISSAIVDKAKGIALPAVPKEAKATKK